MQKRQQQQQQQQNYVDVNDDIFIEEELCGVKVGENLQGRGALLWKKL